MPHRPVHRATTLDLPEAGVSRIAVVADTHSSPHPMTAARLRAIAPVAVLHAGDIGDLAVLDVLGAIAPVFAVRGNIDTHAPGTPDGLTLDLRSGGRSLLKILLVHVAVAGPRLRADAAKLARAEGASLVVCGHSHVPFATHERGLTVFNPGSIGPRRFGLPIVFGVLEVSPERVALRHVDCETGETWLPPASPRP